jgi:two-component sensor histidine kinase
VSSLFIDDADHAAVAGRLAAGEVVADYPARLRTPEGRVFDVAVNAHRVIEPDGAANGNEGILRDVSERKRAEERLLASLQEKSVLLKEIHHRVKNNLQIISSLLYLQEDRLKDPSFKAIIRQCQNQVFSMALIHEDLYRSSDLSSVDFGTYVRTLVTRLLGLYRSAGQVSYVAEVDQVNLRIDAAIPCGLILNELCTNALKYAFPPGRDGLRELRVAMHRTEAGFLHLTVADTGVGLPDGMEVPSASSLGMQIVWKLVEQLRGSIRVDGSRGTRYDLEFPVSPD